MSSRQGRCRDQALHSWHMQLDREVILTSRASSAGLDSIALSTPQRVVSRCCPFIEGEMADAYKRIMIIDSYRCMAQICMRLQRTPFHIQPSCASTSSERAIDLVCRSVRKMSIGYRMQAKPYCRELSKSPAEEVTKNVSRWR